MGTKLQNDDDFTFSKVEATIKYLQVIFNRSISEMKLIGHFEYGVNINTGALKPFDAIIVRYQSIVTTATNPFYVFYNKSGKPYSKFCSFTHYTVKCYDKAKQMGLYGIWKILTRYLTRKYHSIAYNNSFFLFLNLLRNAGK